MTLMEWLRSKFGNQLDAEYEDTKDNEVEPTEELKDDIKKDIDLNEDTDNKDKDGGEQVVENQTMFENGWFNSDKLTVDKSKIKSAEALEAINQVLEVVTSNANRAVIDRAVAEAITGCNSVVSESTLINMLDLSNVTVKDGKAVGVNEAIEALKSKEPKLFSEPKEESNPIKEGFNPVNKGSKTINTYEEALLSRPDMQ